MRSFATVVTSVLFGLGGTHLILALVEMGDLGPVGGLGPLVAVILLGASAIAYAILALGDRR